MRVILIAAAAVALVGCASNTERYYEAVQKAAAAQAAESQARYDALTRMASQGGETGAAAVMAIALSERPVIQPQYIESSALKWAQVLIPGATALGGMYLQADLAKETARINRDIQVGQQQMVLGMTEQYASASQSSNTVALAGFDALTNVSLAGFDTASDISAQGFNTASDISAQGFDAAQSTALAGFGAAVTINGTGVTALNNANGRLAGVTSDVVLQDGQTITDIIQGFRDILANLPQPVIVDPVVVPPTTP